MTGDTLDARTDESLTILATRLGRDVPYFASPESAHFDPISVGIALAALLIGAYLRGFISEAEKQTESLGGESFIWLRNGIRRLFSKSQEAPENISSTVKQLAKQTDAKIKEMSSAEVDQVSEKVRKRSGG